MPTKKSFAVIAGRVHPTAQPFALDRKLCERVVALALKDAGIIDAHYMSAGFGVPSYKGEATVSLEGHTYHVKGYGPCGGPDYVTDDGYLAISLR